MSRDQAVDKDSFSNMFDIGSYQNGSSMKTLIDLGG